MIIQDAFRLHLRDERLDVRLTLNSFLRSHLAHLTTFCEPVSCECVNDINTLCSFRLHIDAFVKLVDVVVHCV